MLTRPSCRYKVCLFTPDSDRPEITIDRILLRETPPTSVFVHYIPEFLVIRYPIHWTIIGLNTMYRVHLDGNVVRNIVNRYVDNDVRSLDLHIWQQLRVCLKQGSERDAYDEHLVGYIKTMDIEMTNKHVAISPMFVISDILFFLVKFSVISWFCIPDTTIDRTLFRRPTSPV